jgi:hypothetical protein
VAGALGLAAAVALIGCLPSGSRGSPSSVASSSLAAGLSAQPTATTPSGPTSVPSFVPPTPTPAPTFLVVTVRSGESLNTIAHRYGTTARSIAFWNRTTYPSLNPESSTYKPGLVKVGWTLYLVPNLVVDEETGEAVDPSDSLAEP